MTRGTRLAFLGAAVVVVIVAIVITASGGNGGDDGNGQLAPTAETGPTGTAAKKRKPKKPEPEVTKIKVVNGKASGGVERIEVNQGDRVRFEVSSDVADEVHVHAYDHIKNVAAGGSVRFNFEATISGRFEIELEHREEQIAALVVKP